DRLLAGWQKARAQGVNNRNAAASLGVSEAELIASACGRFVTRLSPQPQALLRELRALGKIKAVARNHAAVLERDGTVRRVETGGPNTETVHADNFDMICDISRWTKAFALSETGTRGVKHSLQFFTAVGMSAAKFFLRPSSDLDAFTRLTAA